MREAITPLLLTFDEMPNLERTFAPLAWAKRIVVVDSGSTDGTREWLARDPRVDLFTRTFDTFVAQGEFGLRETGIATPWVLSLDADHEVTTELVDELAALEPQATDAYEARFVYCIQGKRLRCGLYPPRIVLARSSAARFVADGHAHRLAVGGGVERLESAILHDDRKPRARFLAGQARYAPEEAEKLLATAAPGTLSTADRIRKLGWIAPWLVPFWCLVVKRGLLDGRAGLVYAGERAIAEWLIAMALAERRLRS